MRKLNELLRSLSRFLHDPAAHVGDAWKTVRGTFPPAASLTPQMRDALVVIDNVVAATVYFLTDKTEAPEVDEPVAPTSTAS